MTIICLICVEHGRGRVEMTFRREKETVQIFECAVCGSYRAVTKNIAGGTYGAGEREDGRRGSVGTGFGGGTSTVRRYRAVR